MERLKIDDAQIEYEVRGRGEPVLLVQVGVVADGLAWPLFSRPELAEKYRLIHYHRRGYMGSTVGSAPLTVARQAGDAAALLKHLEIETAHVAGHSIGGLIALQLAVDAPSLVHSLALLEPSLPMVPGGKAALERTFTPVMAAYRAGDKRKAIEIFSDSIFGQGWQAIVEKTVPGRLEQGFKDADAFMQDGAAVQQWQFGPGQAALIRQPVLSLLGTRPAQPYTHQFSENGRALLHAWFPQTEDADVPTTHLLQMQDPRGVARALAEFFARHPIAQTRSTR